MWVSGGEIELSICITFNADTQFKVERQYLQIKCVLSAVLSTLTSFFIKINCILIIYSPKFTEIKQVCFCLSAINIYLRGNQYNIFNTI